MRERVLAYFQMHRRDRWLQRRFVITEAAVYCGPGSTASFYSGGQIAGTVGREPPPSPSPQTGREAVSPVYGGPQGGSVARRSNMTTPRSKSPCARPVDLGVRGNAGRTRGGRGRTGLSDRTGHGRFGSPEESTRSRPATTPRPLPPRRARHESAVRATRD